MSNLIVRQKAELETKNQEIVEVEDISYVQLDLNDFDGTRAKNILAQIVQYAQLTGDFIKSISSDSMYVLDVPKKIADGLKKGTFELMQKKDTKESLAAVYEIVDGKKKLFTNLPVKETKIQNPVASRDITMGFQQLALQQQMAVVLNEIEDVHRTVALIEKGQQDDRFAEIKSGYDLLRIALKTGDEEKRNRLIENAMQTISSGSNKVQMAMSRRIDNFEAIPNSDAKLYLKMLLSRKNYIKQKDEEYDEICECFDYCETASRLMAYASMMEGEPRRVDEIYSLQEDYIKSLDVRGLRSMSKIHPEISFDDEWYSNPQGYIDEIKQEYTDFINGKYDYVAIETSGAQLLEVLENEENQ